MQEQKLLRRKKKAISDGNKTALAAICIDLADLYSNAGRYEDAVDEYIIVADVYKEMGKQMDYARANRMIGEACTQLREYDKALRYQRIHLKTAREQKDKLEEQRALATIGHTHLTRYLDNVDNPDKTPLNLAYKSFMHSMFVCESLTGISKHEHKDMTARLFANLGVVQECLGNYDNGIGLIQKSINICKTHDLYEQLERGYTFLGSLYVRKKEYNKAINQYNLAIEVAERLKNKVTLMCTSLSAKADILIKLADFHGAKTVFLKAYKLKNPSIAERENIEHNLKVVAAMCRTEESLLTTSDTDYETKKRLYEKLGDGACKLKNYPKAIEYYQKMLEAAKSNGESGLDLSPCYISLAETYRDDRQFDMAISFFKQEFATSKGNAKESVPTLLNIADCMEAAGYDVSEIENTYIQARNECIGSGEKRLECKVLVRYISILRKSKKIAQAVALEKEINNMDLDNLDSDSEESPEQATPDIGDDICIKDLTDISDESGTENNISPSRSVRKRTKSLARKLNNKGETQLHTACIKGNIYLVKRWLDQGLPVNDRDYCGWLPIHEACICGHIQIVKMLIEKGAHINDRGGNQCNGMTPLHDAATNGHLDVMKLLLDKGASSIAKNDIGETPLHILKKWHASLKEELEPAEQNLYDELVQQLTQDMEKSGHGKDFVLKDENTAVVAEEDEPVVQTQVETKRRSNDAEGISVIGNLRRHVSRDNDLDELPHHSRNKEVSESDVEENNYMKTETNAKDEYKRVMHIVRHGQREDSIEKKRKSSESQRKSPYVPKGEGDDDWLEDDLRPNQHKRPKTASTDGFVNSTGMRKRSSGSLKCHSSSASLKSRGSLNEDIDMNGFFESEFDTNQVENHNSIEVDDSDEEFKSNGFVGKKRKTQMSLMDSGFTRHRSFSPTNMIPSGNSASVKRKHQAKLTNFGQPSISGVESKHGINNYMSSTLSVDVRIDGKLYRVPVLATEIQSRTIKWLAEEASRRYSRKECMKPTLELETMNGAVLADDDYLNILFAAGSLQAEEVQARVLKWNLPPLSDRYTEACVNMDIAPSEQVIKILQETSAALDLSDLGLENKHIVPLCKAINKQINLHYLILSGNFILNESVQSLCLSLPSLDNLTVLNLSLNHLTSESVGYLANMFTESSKTLLENLVTLDLSYNPLGNESLKYLAIITRYLRLQNLKLVNVDFTNDIFNTISNRNVDLSLDFILNFDISYNRLGKLQIAKFLSWLKPENMEVLDISNNAEEEDGLVKEVVNWLQTAGNTKLNLKQMNLARCRATDPEIYELLRMLVLADGLKSLNLAYNKNLTSSSLRRLMQHQPSFDTLDLSGCENIFKYFEDCTESTWSSVRLQHVKLSVDKEHNREKIILVNMWQNKYGDKAKIVNELRGFIELSICE